MTQIWQHLNIFLYQSANFHMGVQTYDEVSGLAKSSFRSEVVWLQNSDRLTERSFGKLAI